jgi:hypothetical protein
MLHSSKNLRKFHVHAQDGDIGAITDAYFDDDRWTLRYLVVKTGGWLSGREVLVSPYSVSAVDDGDRSIVTRLTRAQVEASPSIDVAKPISRQQEADYLSYYGYPLYWPYATLWAWGAVPVIVPPDPRVVEELEAERRQAADTADTHLRSVRDSMGYHIQATDEPVGHAEDYLFEDDSWAIRYLVVDTRNWLPGRHVLVSTQWIREVSWPERSVAVDLSRSAIENSPEYDPDNLPSRSYETDLHKHYARPGYWS